jgi:hypothetical protein
MDTVVYRVVDQLFPKGFNFFAKIFYSIVLQCYLVLEEAKVGRKVNRLIWKSKK